MEALEKSVPAQIFVITGFAFLGIAAAMIIIIYTAFQNERQKKEDEKRNPDEDNELDPDTEQYELMISLPQTDNSVMENGKSHFRRFKG